MSIVRGSLLPRPLHAHGLDRLMDSNWNQHALVHSVEQPISNIVHETKTVVKHAWKMSDSVLKLGLIWFGGWMAYTAVGDAFPRATRELEGIVGRAWKRARL